MAEWLTLATAGLRDVGCAPASDRARLAARAASTEMRDGRWLTGEVHDPRAHLLGGVAGHAGLFSTAADVARFARMILGGGALEGRRVLAERTVTALLQPRAIPGGQRALFGDLPLGGAVSHTGFTGTYLRIDRAPPGVVVLAKGVDTGCEAMSRHAPGGGRRGHVRARLHPAPQRRGDAWMTSRRRVLET